MFRLFIKNMVKSGKNQLDPDRLKNKMPPQKLRYRRIYERFDIDHKHLTLMNEQDIFVVRDISVTGFSIETSERGFKRLHIGDEYICKIRYLGELYQFKAAVRWKAKNFVGFEIIRANKELRMFLKRILLPLEVGMHMQVAQNKKQENRDGRKWFIGPGDSHLFYWPDDKNDIYSFKFYNGIWFLFWEQDGDKSTGTLKKDKRRPSMSNPFEFEQIPDDNFDDTKRQYVLDMFMAMNDPAKNRLISCLTPLED